MKTKLANSSVQLKIFLISGMSQLLQACKTFERAQLSRLGGSKEEEITLIKCGLSQLSMLDTNDKGNT